MFSKKPKIQKHPQSVWSEFTSVAAINGRFLMAALMMILAYKLWPDRPEWWGFGLISICIWAGAISHAVGGFRDMFRLIERGRTIADQTQDAAEAKQARKVTTDVLRNAGMKR